MPRRKHRSPEPPPRFVRKLNTIGTHRRIVKTIGSIVLLKSMTERMNIRAIIDSIIPMQREVGLTHGQIVEAMVINRCHSPVPLYDIENWTHESGMADLYGCSHELFNDDRIRATLDVLPDYESDIQGAIALRLISEFGVPAKDVLYDITSLYFEGEYDESEVVRYGYSRDQKPDKKQVNVGLSVSAEAGVPFKGDTIKGNTADPATVEENVKSLRQVITRQKFLQITDGGMLTPANVHFLEQEGIEFLAPWKANTALLNLLQYAAIEWKEMPYRGANGKDRYWAAELGIEVVYEEELTDQPPAERQPGQRGRLPNHPVVKHIYWERAILIRSSNKQSRDEKTRAKNMQKIEEALMKMQAGLNKRRLKTRTQVESKLDRIFSGNLAQYRRCIDITVEGPDGQMELTWSWNSDALERLKARDSIYVLLTNCKDPEKYPLSWALETYKRRNVVEQRIRDLKSHVKIRPLFVHTDKRIQALVLITIVALQLYSLIEWEARRAQEKWTTSYLKKVFSSVSILQTLNADGSSEMEWCNLMPQHLRILEKLGLKLIDLPDRLEPFT